MPGFHRRGGQGARISSRAELAAQQAFSLPAEREHRVERRELLDALEKSFKEGYAVVLHGITGSGKTWLAEAYGRANVSDRQVYWIDVSTEGLLSAYTRLAQKLGLITCEELETPRSRETALARLKGYFVEHPDCLLILDDVVSEEELTYNEISLIPDGVQILITSQSSLFSCSELLEVEKLKPEEAVELLERTIAQAAPLDLLEKFADQLLYHPLLINMTGRYIHQVALRSGEPVATIISGELLKLEHAFHHFPKGRKEQIKREIQKRWEINFSRAKEEDENVGECLGICAYLAPENIPMNWFNEEQKKTFKVLERFGFCRVNSCNETISIHNLVQLITREMDRDYFFLDKALDLVITKWAYYDEHDFKSRFSLVAGSIHTDYLIALVMGSNKIMPPEQEARVVKLLHHLGAYWRDQFLFEKSLQRYKQALNLCRNSTAYRWAMQEADIYSSLGALYRDQGQHARCEEYYGKSVDEYSQFMAIGPCRAEGVPQEHLREVTSKNFLDHLLIRYGDALNGLATAYWGMGDYGLLDLVALESLRTHSLLDRNRSEWNVGMGWILGTIGTSYIERARYK